MNIVLSIKPKYAKLIYEGKKTLELRKTVPLKNVERVYLYETAPVCKVTGFFKYFAYARITKKALKTCKDTVTENSQVPLKEIKNYFGKSDKIFGWVCHAGSNSNIFSTPIPLSAFEIKRAPQSWCYTEFTVNATTKQDVIDEQIRFENKQLRRSMEGY